MSTRLGRHWNERTRMLLTLQLAVVLPAVALILFTVWNLRNIQRDRAVEAAIQRDFSQVLQITEKRLNEIAYKSVSDARAEFPCPSDSADHKLDKFLEENPQFAHAFLADPGNEITIRSQYRKERDEEAGSQRERFEKNVRWLKEPGGKELAKELRYRDKMAEKMAKEYQMKEYKEKEMTKELKEKERAPYEKPVESDKKEILIKTGGISFFSEEGNSGYANYAVMTLPNCENENLLGGVAFDTNYLQRKTFPSVLNGVLAEKSENSSNPVVMMLRGNGEREPVAASEEWDGGKPELERKFAQGESAFPMLVLAIKFRGTTIAALSEKFLMTNFLIIGGISILLLFGIWQTYRNVSREMALARLKSDFVANVSHELRTPLSLIRLYAETLEMGRLTGPEKPQEYYRIIRKESERLTSLINNILDFSRIEAGGREYDFKETDLAELVRNTLETYRNQIERSGFVFQAEIADDLPPMWIDREAIARSFLNLINNAVKYSREDKFLDVKLCRKDSDVQLEVRDRGIGIPRNEQSKIFEKFYRVGDPLVHNTKGSGLGLSLVHHIIQAHGGQVRVESEPGKGSIFTITLPLVREHSPAPTS